MTKLLYSHQNVKPLAEVVARWLYRKACRVVRTSLPGRPLGRRGRRFLTAGLVLFVLVIEGVMLYTLATLVELCIALMELWTELARKHLEITL